MFIVECSLHTTLKSCKCVDMVSVKSASRYQSRLSMYIRGLILRNEPRQFRLQNIGTTLAAFTVGLEALFFIPAEQFH